VADAVLTDLEEIAGAAIDALARGLNAGHFTASDLTGAYLARIEALDSDYNAFCHVDGDSALEQAALSDQRRDEGDILSAFDGIPFAVADLIDVAGLPTAAGLSFRRNKVASADADAVARWRRLGLIPLGKTNVPDLGLGQGAGESAFGRVLNPLTRTAIGGNAAGAACAVAAGLAPLALACDTMGSLRLAAIECGLTGYRPSRDDGWTSGLVSPAFSFDAVGVIARGPAGLIGPDATLTSAVTDRFIWGRPAGFDDLDMHLITRRSLAIFEVEAAMSFETDMASHADEFPGAVLDMLNLGSRVPAVKIARARRDLASAGRLLRGLFSDVDILILPMGYDPSAMINWALAADIAGLPSISLPVNGAHGGLQLLAAQGRDKDLVSAARAFMDLMPPPVLADGI
jgi:aspartyl-tRNA(Asn)/glutamyl-tRNA(Gln) amidotransferase subunit A